VRDTGEMFKLIENLNFFEKVNLYISIYSNVDAGIGDIKFYFTRILTIYTKFLSKSRLINKPLQYIATF
jgi:hypothetical protein